MFDSWNLTHTTLSIFMIWSYHEMSLVETVKAVKTISWVIIYVVRAQNIRFSVHSLKTLMEVKAQRRSTPVSD